MSLAIYFQLKKKKMMRFLRFNITRNGILPRYYDDLNDGHLNAITRRRMSTIKACQY